MSEREIFGGDDERSETEEIHFLSVSEVAEPFDHMLQEFMRETDRGAVLIAADIVAATLGAVITSLSPPEFGARRLKDLLRYPGTIASFSSRADIAFLAGFIDANSHKSISHLRRLRNLAAHSQSSFKLADHRDALRSISDLGPGTATGVNRFAAEFLLRNAVEGLLRRGVELEAEIGRNPFASPTDVIDELRKRPEAMTTLEDRRPRMELAFGVWILLGLIRVQERAAVKQRGASASSDVSRGKT